MFVDIRKAVALANHDDITAFGHYVEATIHRGYSEFHDSIQAAKRAKLILESKLKPESEPKSEAELESTVSRFSIFMGHTLNQLGLAQLRAGLFREADSTLLTAFEHAEETEKTEDTTLDKSNLSAAALVNYSENNISYRTNTNLSQAYTNWSKKTEIKGTPAENACAQSALQYAKIAYFNYAQNLRAVDKAYCLTVLAESLVCVLNQVTSLSQISEDVTASLPQILDDLNILKSEYLQRSPEGNDNVLRFLITSLELHYRLHCLNPAMISIDGMQDLRDKLLDMETTTEDLQVKKSAILDLTDRKPAPIILRPSY